MRCPKCKTEMTRGATFCSNCGAQFKVTCPACGANNQAAAIYCAQCGVHISTQADPGIQAQPVMETLSNPQHNPTPLQAEGYERRMVTILFADIVSFSTLSEHIDPEDLLEIMRQAYPCLLEPVQDHAGAE